MTLRHLKIFVAVCENGGITKAADALHMVQPAVSTTVSELEKYYKAALFDRINQRLVLTELGKELLVKAKRILEEFEDFEETATLGGLSPRLRIGSSLTLGKTVLPRFFTVIKEKLPQLDPIFSIDKTAVIEEKLECGALDLGIVEGEVYSGHLKRQPLGEDRLVAVCAPTYDVPQRIPLKKLVAYPWLLRETGSATRDMLHTALAEKHLSVTPFVESASNEALLSFAEAGHGIAILPEGIVDRAIGSRLLRPIEITDTKLVRTHFIVMHKNKQFNALCQSAIEILTDILKPEQNFR